MKTIRNEVIRAVINMGRYIDEDIEKRLLSCFDHVKAMTGMMSRSDGSKKPKRARNIR